MIKVLLYLGCDERGFTVFRVRESRFHCIYVVEKSIDRGSNPGPSAGTPWAHFRINLGPLLVPGCLSRRRSLLCIFFRKMRATFSTLRCASRRWKRRSGSVYEQPPPNFFFSAIETFLDPEQKIP